MGPAHTSRTRTPHLRPRDGAASLTLGLDTCGPCEPESPCCRAGPWSLSKRRSRPPSFQLRRRRRRLGVPPVSAGLLPPPPPQDPRAAQGPLGPRPHPLGLTGSSLAAWTRKPGKVSHEGLETGEGRAGRRRRGCTCAEGGSGAARRRRVAELRSWQVPLLLRKGCLTPKL